MLKIKEVSKLYNPNEKNSFLALDKISFTLPTAGLVIIKGKSGSGKTTLLNVMSGLDIQTDGEILYNNEKINIDHSSFVFQDSQLIDNLSVYDNLQLVTNCFNVDQTKVSEYLEQFDLVEYKNHFPNQLSGGQKQRIAIIRALLMNKSILFADEPTGNLDENTSKDIVDIFVKESENRLVVIVTHDPEYFIEYANIIISLKDGKVEDFKELKKSEKEIEYSILEPKLDFKSAFKLSFKGLRKNLFRYISFFLTLFLSTILTISSLNILLNSEGKIIQKALKDNEIETLDFYKMEKKEEIGISDEEFQILSEKYNVNQFVDDEKSLHIEDLTLTLNRIYLTNKVKHRVIYGSSSIEEGEIVVSDYLAYKIKTQKSLSDIEQVINQEVMLDEINLVIKGIYKTDYKLDGEIKENSEKLEKYYQACFITMPDFNASLSTDSHTIRVLSNTISCNNINIDDKQDTRKFIIKNGYELNEKPIVAGENDRNLLNNEIGISKYTANKLIKDMKLNNIEELIGKELKFEIIVTKVYADLESGIIRSKEFSFKIKNIYEAKKGFNNDDIYTSKELSNQIILNYGAFMPHLKGISLFDVNSRAINGLIKDKFVHNIYLSNSISDGIDWINTLSIVEIVVGAILLIISIITLMNFVSTSISKDKRELGVLTSWGIKNKSLSKIYLIQCSLIVLSAFLLSSVLALFITKLMNYHIINSKITTINCIYNDFRSVLIILMIFVLITVFSIFFTMKKLKKRTAVDIIYER